MIAVIPVFLSEPIPPIHFVQDIRERIACLAELNEVQNLVVITNSDAVKDHCLESGWDVIGMKDSGSHRLADQTASGPQLAAAGLRHSSRFKDEDDILLIDIDNSPTDPGEIRRAIACYLKNRPEALLSVTECEINPCQMNAYLKISRVGCVHLLEQQPLSSEPDFWEMFPKRPRVTQPFYFDWQTKDMADVARGSIFLPRVSEGAVVYDQIDENPSGAAGCLVYEGRASARLLLPEQSVASLLSVAEKLAGGKITPVGVSLAADFSFINGLLFHHSLEEYCLAIPLGRGLEHNFFFSLEILTPQRQIRLPSPYIFRPAESEGLAIFRLNSEMPWTNPFSFCCLTEIIEGPYDLAEPFIPEVDLWKIDKKLGRHINTRNGKEICGRQDFPKVYKPDGSFCITRRENLDRLENIQANGKAQGLIIGKNKRIETLVEPLREFHKLRQAASFPHASVGTET